MPKASSEPYPRGMKAIPQRIPGRAFFPSGAGIWKEMGIGQSHSPRRPIMVSGYDFDSEVAYGRSFEIGDDTHGPSRLNLGRLFNETGIQMGQCFLTYYFMSMRRGRVCKGRSPASYSHQFIEHCGDFLIEHLKPIRPRVILSLRV
jgi:hypothetical protein